MRMASYYDLFISTLNCVLATVALLFWGLHPSLFACNPNTRIPLYFRQQASNRVYWSSQHFCLQHGATCSVSKTELSYQSWTSNWKQTEQQVSMSDVLFALLIFPLPKLSRTDISYRPDLFCQYFRFYILLLSPFWYSLSSGPGIAQ
jgi:hypothetical protein